MKNKKRIWIALFLMVCMCMSTGLKASADYSPESRLESLGIMDISGRESSIITKGEFVKAIAVAAGLGDNAQLLRGATIFSDIEYNSELSGYVNAAVNKGMIKGSIDGKFHPEANMTFAQVCAILVKALGYTDKDLQGSMPNSYIMKAKALGIAAGINLGGNDGVTNLNAAYMINRLLDSNIVKTNSTDADKTFAQSSGLTNESYAYANIASPVYSNPQVASGVTSSTSKIGDIDLTNSIIIKNGTKAQVSDIEDNDVLYRVSDAADTKSYVLVVDNKAEGKITSISPTGIQIDSKDYQFGDGFDFYRAVNSYDNLKVGDYATALLGYDGKVVDFYDIGGQDNSSFAFVVNYSYDSPDYRVKLLMIDGNVREYKARTYPGSYKGELVQFTRYSDETVDLTGVSYSSLGDVDIDKASRKVGDDYVSHNVRIFNLVNGNTDNDEDSDVNIINWSDMPDGMVESGKILCENKTSTYGDINVMVVSDMSDSTDKTGIIKSVTPVVSHVTDPTTGQSQDVITGYNYSIIIDGTVKIWNSSISTYSAGSIVNVKVLNGSIEYIESSKNLAYTGYKFDSVDSNRVKISGVSYYLTDNPVVYFRDSDGNYELKNLSDIETGRYYTYVSLYLNESTYYGGKVDTIIIYR